MDRRPGAARSEDPDAAQPDPPRPRSSRVTVGDTIGDSFKETAGPGLHVLIKLLATITLVLAPLFV